MTVIQLRQLDKRLIAVELTVRDQKRVLKGTGNYHASGDLGPSLHVEINDAAGGFEFVLKESEWKGQIESGERFNCDFAVQLDASCLCPR
jgi:hypothetical protein